MDREQAKRNIKETFEASFNEEKFIYFIINLFNLKQSDIKNTSFGVRQGYNIPEMFRSYISRFQRIAKYLKDDNRIDVLIVYLKKETSIEYARSMQRNFIAGYLKGNYGSDNLKDAALVAFVSPDKEDWRFSLVKIDYRFEEGKTGRKVKEEFTPARRWSFLVGKNEKSHTAQSQLVDMLADDKHNPTLSQLEEAFNIETVTKEFFIQYRNLFIQTKEALDKVLEINPKVKFEFEAKGVNTIDFAKKLLGQIVFLYFLQKKSWFGVGRDSNWGTGSKHFLRELFEKKHSSYYNFFNDILEPLFYEALRVGEDRRHLDYYYSRFNCRIPFLNGGLFDPIGNYDWVHTDIVLPDSLFSNNISTKEGDIGNGILDIFDRYNFTVREDEPLEKEVAIDPELLGKAYEKFNAIRPDNFEEYKKVLRSGKKGSENKFNKQYGVYYTPREIVHYMCQQSLIHYLMAELNGDAVSYERVGESNLDMFGNKARKGQLDITIEHKDHPTILKEDIDAFIRLGEQFRENDEIALIKEEQINNGMQKSSTIEPLLPESIRKNASLIDEKLENITICDPAVGSGAFPVGMMNEIVKARTVLTPYLEDDFRTTYNFKRQCIEKSLYGVDIDPGAVEIAKLRLWLSLIIEEEDFKEIKPLPNLDYKIVCGNSLLGYPYTPRGLEKIEQLKIEFFNETNPLKKNKLKDQVNDAIYSLYKDTNRSLGYKVNFDFKINFSEIFRKNGGFDVVIANPPYVGIAKLVTKNLLKKQNFTTFESTGDIYSLFYEKGNWLLKYKGLLCFITSNKWLRTNYGRSTRKFFLEHTNPLQLLDFGQSMVFDSAIVHSNILLFEKATNQHKTLACQLKETEYKLNKSLVSYFEQYQILVDYFTEDIWSIKSKQEIQIKEKIERVGEPLRNWKINFYRGILTGLNEAFIIDTKTKNELIQKDAKNTEIIKPILRGRDVRRYYCKFANFWLINTHNGLKHKGIKQIDVQKEFPTIYKYLLRFKDKAEPRADQGDHWTNLRNCAFLHEIEKPKIVFSEIVSEPQFHLDIENYYPEATAFLITGNNLKYLIALLNSKTITYVFKNFYAGGELVGKYRYKKAFLQNLPLAQISKSQQQPFISCVDSIITITKDEDYLQNQQKQARVKNLEQEIDQMVYQLYGLTEEEIAIITGNVK
ncbi:Eco57I restriction-modification methylase domain-containing protein [bacterium]|nr:Eco57I restriction-modification methylase domain-containing protein [bacterium]MBU4509688.1 Eco57I restriction-modification methylase domain-containing protein [bacterium]